VAFYKFKKKKCWIIKAYDRQTKRTISWVTGNRDTTTFRRLYEKVQHLSNCLFYTDDWDAFAKVLPKKRHIIGKSGTVGIERDNSNTRHNLARMTRRTKVVSRSERMINKTLKLWVNLREKDIFDKFQSTALTIF